MFNPSSMAIIFFIKKPWKYDDWRSLEKTKSTYPVFLDSALKTYWDYLFEVRQSQRTLIIKIFTDSWNYWPFVKWLPQELANELCNEAKIISTVITGYLMTG